MASAEAQAFNGDWGSWGGAPSGGPGVRALGGGHQGALPLPLKPTRFLFKTVILTDLLQFCMKWYLHC